MKTPNLIRSGYVYTLTDDERQAIVDAYFASVEPFVLKQFPKKLKKKYAVIETLATLFKDDTVYSELDVNEILKPVWHDYVMLRRFMVDFALLTRTKDGSEYRKAKTLN